MRESIYCMKILEIIHGLPSGGAERFVVDLSNELAKTNDVELLTLKDDSRNGMGFYLGDISSDVKYHNMRFADKFHINYLWEVYKYIKNVNPDVVHIHIVAEYCILPLLLMHRKVKFFQTIHIDIRKAFKSIKRKFVLYTFGLFHMLHYVTISKTNYMDMCNRYHFCKNSLIYNGRASIYKSESFSQVQVEIDNFRSTAETKVFLHIARCEEQKNQELLIRAFNNIVSKGVNAVLIIIGAGFYDTERGCHLRGIACDKVFFLGTKNNIGDYFYCCDVFCLSSLYEGMPITAIEAILCGVPVISTPVCGVIDVIENGRNGLIAKDFSEKAYEECLMTYFLKSNCFSGKRFCPSWLMIGECASNYMRLFNG